ncbi:MAG: hypothetical protein MJ238_01105 [Bacilli bacterium]|nr:hypothetical protein [Bacilli bacterium]
MKKSALTMVISSTFLLLTGCGGTPSNSEKDSEIIQSSIQSDIASSSSISSEEIVQSSSVVSSSSSSAPTLSSSSSSSQAQQDTPTDGWSLWSEGLKDQVNGFLNSASGMESNIVSNRILNGVVSNGESSYSEYSFRKGKLASGEQACYQKTPTQTTYYYYEGSAIGGYVEKTLNGEKVYSKAPSATNAKFIGYDMTSLMVSSGKGICGGFASLSKMVENGIANGNKDTKFKIRDDGFDMAYAIYSKTSYTYWDAEISAKFANDGTLVGLKYKYAESYAKNVDKHEDGTFSFKTDAVLDYKETIYTAEAGELDILPLPVEPTAFYYSSFDVYSNDTKIEEGATVNAEVGDEGVILDVKNLLPVTASYNFDEWIIKVKNEAGKEVSDGNYFEPKTSQLYLTTIRQTGTYSVTIKTKQLEKQFNIQIGAVHAESITFTGLKQETGGMSLIDIKSSISVGDTTNVCAYVNPVGAPQDLTMEIITPVGVNETDYTFTQKTYKTTDMTFVYYVFSSKKAGAFQFKATSKDDPSVNATHTINVLNPLNADEIYSGKYCYYNEYTNSLGLILEFTPNLSTSKLGDGEVKVTTVRTGKYGLYTYAANSTGKTITLTYRTDVPGTVEDLLNARMTSDGSRSSVVLTYQEDPVGWATNFKLLDWPDYEAKYLR